MSIQFSLEIKGDRFLAGEFDRFAGFLKNFHRYSDMRQATEQVGHLLSRTARAKAPVGVSRKTTGARSGLLRSAIGHEVKAGANKVTIRIGITESVYAQGKQRPFSKAKIKRYASAQEYGAGPHLIAQRKKSKLTFFSDWSNSFVSFIEVEHPGNPALHYFSDAAADNKEEAIFLLQRGLTLAAKKRFGRAG